VPVLRRLRLKNFKAWGEQLWEPGLELGPITLVLGPNSAGKTSILQLPLLLKQTFESADRSRCLNLGGQATDLVDFGGFDALVHDNEHERELGLGLSVQPPTVDGAPELPGVAYAATYRLAGGRAPALQKLELARVGRENRRFLAERQAEGGFVLEAPGLAPRSSDPPERSLDFAPELIVELGPLGSELVDLSSHVRRATEAIAYLGPLRAPPERSYLWSGVAPSGLGKRGEHAIDALLASDNASTPASRGEEAGRGWLVEQVSTWLRRLGLADELLLVRQADPRRYEVMVQRDGRRSNLVDVGSGVSQVLPILVLAYFAPKGATIIAEQPEIHLHPRAQVGLAELMTEVAATRGVQFIVETHSELLFRRLQSLIADEVLSADACRFYFVDRDATQCAQLTRLDVDQHGRVQNWPKNLFGDAIGETERQTRKMLERVARARANKGR
jgi:predicted ATPase